MRRCDSIQFIQMQYYWRGHQAFLAPDLPGHDYQEWIDAYWARDILELFHLERRHSFRRLFELILTHSGGVFESTRYARPCEVSRTTIANYLAVQRGGLGPAARGPAGDGDRMQVAGRRVRPGRDEDLPKRLPRAGARRRRLSASARQPRGLV